MAVTNTNAMKYDLQRHFYVLEPEYLKSEYGLDFVERYGSLTKAHNKLVEVSRMVYNTIYNCKLKNKRFWEHFLATVADVRPTIQTALEEQARYEYESNVTALDKQIGINFVNGIKADINDLRGQRRIALEAENALRFYANGALLSTGKEFLMYSDSEFDYTTMGY